MTIYDDGALGKLLRHRSGEIVLHEQDLEDAKAEMAEFHALTMRILDIFGHNGQPLVKKRYQDTSLRATIMTRDESASEYSWKQPYVKVHFVYSGASTCTPKTYIVTQRVTTCGEPTGSYLSVEEVTE